MSTGLPRHVERRSAGPFAGWAEDARSPGTWHLMRDSGYGSRSVCSPRIISRDNHQGTPPSDGSLCVRCVETDAYDRWSGIMGRSIQSRVKRL